MSLILGSGDIPKLISGKQTKGYRGLWIKFIDTVPPNYNALASPINAMRTGVILETPYLNYLGDDYYPQVKHQSEAMDVFKVSIDFAKFLGGKMVDFDELKTIFITDFIDIIKPMKKLSQSDQQKIVKAKFRNNYYQIQGQLFATDLEEANIAFLSVENYDDEENAIRIIEDNDVVKFRIKRDKKAIDLIKERGLIFQNVKDNFN